MMKIRGKVDKSNTYNGCSGNISFFICRTSSDSKTRLITNEVLPLFLLFL